MRLSQPRVVVLDRSRTGGHMMRRQTRIHRRKTVRRVRLLGVTALSFALVTGLAFAAPGKLDPGFGTGGVVSTATAPGAGSDNQDGFAIQPDRRILVAGSSDMGASAGGDQWRISRYTSKGTLDS